MIPQPTAEARPLAGVLVADLTVTLPGPYATSLLARLGARVIKLEPPGGDLTRSAPTMHEPLNAGKESAEVDLARPEDAELARNVVAGADVVVEGWRPGVAARHGLGPEDVRERNPRVVYCSISGYGAAGPLRERPGHDLNYLAMSGMARLLAGERTPEALHAPLADLAGGTFAALRIVAALASGHGAFLDVSITGAIRDWVDGVGGTDSPTSMLPLFPHYGVFETADGHHVTLGNAHEDSFWDALCGALGLEALAGLELGERLLRREELRTALVERFRARTRADVEACLGAVDTCWAFADAPEDTPAVAGMLPGSTSAAPELGAHTARLREEFAPVAR